VQFLGWASGFRLIVQGGERPKKGEGRGGGRRGEGQKIHGDKEGRWFLHGDGLGGRKLGERKKRKEGKNTTTAQARKKVSFKRAEKLVFACEGASLSLETGREEVQPIQGLKRGPCTN